MLVCHSSNFPQISAKNNDRVRDKVSSQAEKLNLDKNGKKKTKVKALLKVSQSASVRESKEQSFNERDQVRGHTAHTLLNLGTDVLLMQQSISSTLLLTLYG